MSDTPLLQVNDLHVRYHTARGSLAAVDGVSLTVRRGETLAVIGESGCGKTSLGKALVGLTAVTAGEIYYQGQALTGLSRRQMQPLRRAIQMIFQDALGALDPRQRAALALDWPLRLHSSLDRAGRQARARQLLAQVGLEETLMQRYPHQLSGGQRQRLNIARALATEPALIVCDEPVSALDVSLQAQVISLLQSLQQRLGVAYVFISHDIGAVQHIADRIAVMYLGRVVEVLPKASLWQHAAHPYTRLLLAAVPRRDPRERRLRNTPLLEGDPPSPFNLPAGCRFHDRCPHASALCRQTEPPLAPLTQGHSVACHHPQAGAGEVQTLHLARRAI
ncbi:ABC transporter ATP-binding protein [Pseudomonas typographi]|uniref:ABC transporter ATP-binding protein n=1 Tax=Pseudomonas typographi TaxID=2715964 RepID=A0ABR7YWX9_9PSED|nr:ABC transporter ATP-binding protein [Pseudomonas typographi]MBD1551269.1 ABC transporter ATP-binding protein [Pseudomonas typographi]MBD1586238.1 ABC transporter ATP-binding protein [Pseudomonas typographi]MBD1597709.1 ABC transporter ATP-binding protein [Pseudomonas typographi]